MQSFPYLEPLETTSPFTVSVSLPECHSPFMDYNLAVAKGLAKLNEPCPAGPPKTDGS